MPRSVPEWIGKTPDSKVPDRVCDRVFERCDGRCHRCSRKIPGGTAFVPLDQVRKTRRRRLWTLEHRLALINGGENRESNLTVTCDACLPAKNAEDVAIKAKSASVRKKHHGIRKAQWRPMPGTRASGVRKRLNGNVERW